MVRKARDLARELGLGERGFRLVLTAATTPATASTTSTCTSWAAAASAGPPVRRSERRERQQARRPRPDRDRRTLRDREEARRRRLRHRLQGQGQELGRLVAIKTIRLEGLAASQAQPRRPGRALQARGQVAAQLKHPNIVTIYDIGSREGFSYLVDGVHRRRRPRPRDRRAPARWPLERAAAIGAQVADALDFAHKHRRRPPRHQAREHHDRAGRPREGHRLRDREGRPDSAEHLTATGQPARHAVLHEPGAGARRGARRAQRPLLGRLHPLRDARRPARLPRRVDHRADLQDHHRGAAVAARARPDRPGRDAADHRQGALEGAGDPLPDGPRAGRRPARDHAAGLRADAPLAGRRRSAPARRAVRRRARRSRRRATAQQTPHTIASQATKVADAPGPPPIPPPVPATILTPATHRRRHAAADPEPARAAPPAGPPPAPGAAQRRRQRDS